MKLLRFRGLTTCREGCVLPMTLAIGRNLSGGRTASPAPSPLACWLPALSACLPFTRAFLRWALWPEIAALEKCAELQALDTAPRPPPPKPWEPVSPSAQGGLLFLPALLQIKAGNGRALVPPLQLWSGGASRVLSKVGGSEGCTPTPRLLEPQDHIPKPQVHKMSEL